MRRMQRFGWRLLRQMTYLLCFYKGKEVIRKSPLGMTIDNRAIGKEVRIKSVTPGEQTNGERLCTYTIERPEGDIYYIDTREYADGIALRYRIPASTNICIYGEATSFTFPSRTKTWYASGPFQYGWLQEYQDRFTDDIEGEILAPPATF